MECERDGLVLLLGKGGIVSRQRNKMESEHFFFFSLSLHLEWPSLEWKRPSLLQRTGESFKSISRSQVTSMAGSWNTLWIWLQNCRGGVFWSAFHYVLFFSCFFACLVIFNWLPDIVNFTLLDAGYFSTVNILELCFETLWSCMEMVWLGLAFKLY